MATAWVAFAAAGCGLSEIPRRPSSARAVDAAAPVAANDAGVVGIALGGEVVHRDGVVVFLHVGHSNMAGRASGPPELRGFNYDPHPRLWSYGADGFVPAREPLSPDNMTAGRAGPGMSILRAGLALGPGRHFVSIGHGHSGQTGGYCRNFRKGGLFYDLAMRPAIALKGKVTFGAIFTMFGTSESNDEENAPRFAQCMAGVAAEMRADLDQPDLPFIVGDWEANSMTRLTPDSPLGRIIVPQLRALPDQIPRAAVIPTEMLPIIPNDHHYDFTGYKLWAERGMAILKARGWAAWAAP